MQKILANLSTRQRITILMVAALVAGGLYSMVQWRKEADFKPLFTGVAPEDAAGLPKSGRIGFELFDKVNLGATEFTEHINYRRALEGELERTVMTLSEVEQARVHLTFPKDSVFLEAQQPAKASVLVRLHPG